MRSFYDNKDNGANDNDKTDDHDNDDKNAIRHTARMYENIYHI